ncbi:rhomboid family intramembrane serine protease, partial [Bacillus pumilus]|uniref:rhomboid family intramembrane serine protease n=1 Tax=Bacillus pumilus TaxID=1408 RepID=UPI0016432A3F
MNYGVGGGEWWGVITGVLVEGSVRDILLNSMWLLLLGGGVEDLVGKVGFVIMYVGGGLIGKVGRYWVEGLEYVDVGGCGGMLGLFGVYL